MVFPTSPPPTTRAKGLLEVARERARLRHLSRFTEKQYVFWIRKFINFHQRRHPRNMGEFEIEQFLSHLAVKRGVAPSTQNQALNAIVFLYRDVLRIELTKFKGVRWAKKKVNIPSVLTRDEVARLLACFQRGTAQKLIAHLLYGCGLRLTEALNLRIKDIDFGQNIITVRDSKGGKDRCVPLPRILISPLHSQIKKAKSIHELDLKQGFGRVSMPYALQRKYPNADKAPLWQYVFPSVRRSRDPISGDTKRHHLYDSIMEEALARAVRSCGLDKRVTCHTFRHSYATHLLESGKDIRTIQTLLGHSDVKTTMIYTHIAKGPCPRCESPLDVLPPYKESSTSAAMQLAVTIPISKNTDVKALKLEGSSSGNSIPSGQVIGTETRSPSKALEILTSSPATVLATVAALPTETLLRKILLWVRAKWKFPTY